MYRKNFLHSDIKASNVLSKLKEGCLIPKSTDVGKVTLKSEPKVCRLSASQNEKYNKKFPHLAYELRNGVGAKLSFASDVCSLGYIFKYSPIKISYEILISKMMVEETPHRVGIIYAGSTLRETFKKCLYCLIVMMLRDFEREFKNFKDFKNVRTSKILFYDNVNVKKCFFAQTCEGAQVFKWEKYYFDTFLK